MASRAKPSARRHRTRAVSAKFVLPAVTRIEPGQTREVVDVIVDGGRIAGIVRPGSAHPDGYDVLDAYRGHFVLPALIDMHGHLPPDNVLRLTGLFLLLHLTHGVTTVRDAGDLDGTAAPAALRGIADGRFLGPRILPSGPFVTRGAPRWPNSIVVTDGVGHVAAEIRASGARCMKLYENLEVADIGALERDAAREGLLTLGHVPTRLGIEEAPLADAQHLFGVPPPASLPRDHVADRTLHWECVDDKRIDVVVRAMADTQRANTPTLVVTDRLVARGDVSWLPRFYADVVWSPRIGLPAYRDPDPGRADRAARTLATKLRLIERLHRAGAPLRIGTDVQQPFVVPGEALHREMALFADAGVPLADVWRLATHDAARALGIAGLGSTACGSLADLGVYARDPTADLANLSSLVAVVHRGALLRRSDLGDEARAEVAARDHGFARISSAVLARLAMWKATRKFVG
jgi:hypothetical protein